MADNDQLLQEAIKRSIRSQIDLLELIVPNNGANAVKAQLEAKEAKIQKLLERLDNEMKQREAVESDLIELRSEKDEMDKEHKATKDTLEREMAEMKSSVELKKQELHRLESENKELEAKLILLKSRHQVELETIKAEKSALEAKIEILEAGTDRDTSDNAQLQQNNTNISKQEINEIEFKLHEIKLSKALEEVRSKNSEIEALNAQLELSTRRINELNRELEVMGKSDEIERLKASHSRELELVKAELEEANRSIESGIRKRNEIEGELQEVSWQKADLERNMFDRTVDELESLKAQFKAEKNELEAELTVLNLVKQVEIESNKAEFENEKSELKKQIDQAKEDEKSALEENRKLVDELSLRTEQLEMEKSMKGKFQQQHASIYVESERLKEDIKIQKHELNLTQARLLRAEIRERINEEEEEEKTDLKFDDLLVKLADLSLNHNQTPSNQKKRKFEQCDYITKAKKTKRV